MIKESRFAGEQIAYALHQAETGMGCMNYVEKWVLVKQLIIISGKNMAAYEHQVALAFSRLGKPTDNAYIESFNGGFRDECANMQLV